MRDLAVFASSEAGRLYGANCERWGVDPGAIFDDDVLAHNLRLGLAVAMVPERDEADDHAALIEQTRRAGEEMRRRLG